MDFEHSKRLHRRHELLDKLGADEQSAELLLSYCQNRFVQTLPIDIKPPPDEPFVSAWRRYAEKASDSSLVEILKKPLRQWNFPVKSGISQQQAYINATRKPAAIGFKTMAVKEQFEKPELITLEIFETAAGNVPILSFATRKDFEYALISLTNRNEPKTINENIGAMLIGGYNNLERIEFFKQEFLKSHQADAWRATLNRLLQDSDNYRDSLILVASGPYSGVSARDMNLPNNEWINLSTKIRKHHEATHYFTRRMLGGTYTNLLDELIADYMGLAQGIGEFKADWFLRFMGVNQNEYTPDSRLEHYSGDIKPGTTAFSILIQLIQKAAVNVEAADKVRMRNPYHLNTTDIMLRLCTMTLEEIASDWAVDELSRFN